MPKPLRSYSSFLLEGNPDEVDAALYRLTEAGCLGAEDLDEAGVDEARRRFFFPPETDETAVVRLLARDFPSLRCGAAELIPDVDWLAHWKRSFKGFALGRRFFICPSWETPPDTERVLLRIDPQRAFGTGTHDTTRLCLEIMEERICPGMQAIDVGSGTGILAMAAAALGCRPVLAIEHDPEAASCAAENVSRNGFSEAVRIQVAAMATVNPQPAPLVVANLNEALLGRQLARLTRWVLPGGHLILGGLLLEQTDSMVERLSGDFHLVQTRTAGHWAAVVACRESDA